MTIYAAILLISASGSATRTLEVEDSIAGVVGQVIFGGVRDALFGTSVGKSLRDRSEWRMPAVSLRIDGQPRAGVVAWGTAAWRVGGWILTSNSHSVHGAADDQQPSGSVAYDYRIQVRGFDVRRHTEISDGFVRLTTDIWGSIGPSAELYHVRLVLDGIELGDGARLRGTATGWSRIGDRCRLVERFASREIRKAMLEVLDEIQRGGTGLYHAGSAEQLIEALR